MDFLGRVEAALLGLGRSWPGMGVAAESILEECGEKLRSRQDRPAYRYLALNAAMVEGDRYAVRSDVATLTAGAFDLLDQPDARPVELLWHHWLLVRAEQIGEQKCSASMLEGLWRKAFARQADEGHLHELNADTLLDAFVYDEFCAIHAAYRSLTAMRHLAMFDPVRRAVAWHVDNTQPDHTTTEPWALAAFAAFDETGTFAEQQLHDAVAACRGWNPVILALLADASLAIRASRGLQ